jgi:hypothetical protein
MAADGAVLKALRPAAPDARVGPTTPAWGLKDLQGVPADTRSAKRGL